MLGRPNFKSSMQHSFANVPKAQIPRSSFHSRPRWIGSCSPDYLIPMYLKEIYPGDTLNLSARMFGRCMPLACPIMDNIYMDTFYFFVPNRLVWTNWVRLMGERDNPDDDIDFSVPQIPAPAVTGFELHSLADYLGLPIGANSVGWEVSALPFRMYNKIYNDWFRSQDLIDSTVVDVDDADSDMADYVLQKRSKRYDYFTGCLPNPQKGDAVELPLGGTAEVKSPYNAGGLNYQLNNSGVDTQLMIWGQTAENSGFYADLAGATAATINSLREAFQLQRMLERDQRSGTRYTETCLAHFGVQNPDGRLMRSEFLGGNSQSMMITAIAQTAPKPAAGTTTVQGNLSAIGTISGKDGVTKSFTEHGYVLGLVNFRADLTYSQGVDKHWMRKTRYDYYFPALANLGEQAVLNYEIFAKAEPANHAENIDVFGYQERWAELRYAQSKIVGVLRPDAPSSLAVWHLSEDFADTPTLSQVFIESAMPIARQLTVTNEPAFLLDIEFDETMVRAMPVNSVPGMIDHF